MAKDTFNLKEWVGKGEKNLLREDERLNEGYILPIIAGLFLVFLLMQEE